MMVRTVIGALSMLMGTLMVLGDGFHATMSFKLRKLFFSESSGQISRGYPRHVISSVAYEFKPLSITKLSCQCHVYTMKNTTSFQPIFTTPTHITAFIYPSICTVSLDLCTESAPEAVHPHLLTGGELLIARTKNTRRVSKPQSHQIPLDKIQCTVKEGLKELR